MAAPSAARFIGQSIKRREDLRLVTGHGLYADDVAVPGVLHAAFLRSDVARGRISRLDTSAAKALPGVHAVLTADDLNARCGPLYTSSSGPSENGWPERPLAQDDVRFVGDPIALVVAENRYIAEDAVDLIDIEIDSLPAVVGLDNAATTSALVHPEVGTNVAATIPAFDSPEIEAIFAGATHVVTRTFCMARATNAPMETRGLTVAYDAFTDQMTIWPSHQSPHEVKLFASRVTGVPANSVHVKLGDVGGGFGQKMFPTRDEAVIMLAGRLLAQPVRWIEDRRESLMAANQARLDEATVTMALDGDARILAAKVHLREDVGAYPPGGNGSVAAFVAMLFSGPYRIGTVAFSNDAYYTNTCGRAAYRGPWLMETVAREQMIDHVAREIGIDPLELRRRNVVQHGDLPFTLPSGLVYDQVTAHETLEQAAAMIDVGAFRAEQAAARAQGRLLGLGFSLSVEPSAVAFGSWGSEQAVVRIDPSGKVLVLAGTGSHGHSLETTIPQVVADYLGCSLDDVVFIQGDTDATPFGQGTGGSRSAVIVGGAARQASLELKEKVIAIAAHLLEAAPDDLEVHDSAVSVKGTPARSVAFANIAATAYLGLEMLPTGVSAGLESQVRFRPDTPFTWSNACHVCTCEIDPATGRVDLLRYVVSEDCGIMINPMVVEGQIAGGVVQGIGGVLLENMAYDDAGNPLATTFLDYLLPTTTEIPDLEYGHIETPANNPTGFKGMGEGGAIVSPACVANAIADALGARGARATHFPFGPSEIMALLHD